MFRLFLLNVGQFVRIIFGYHLNWVGFLLDTIFLYGKFNSLLHIIVPSSDANLTVLVCNANIQNLNLSEQTTVRGTSGQCPYERHLLITLVINCYCGKANIFFLSLCFVQMSVAITKIGSSPFFNTCL